MGKSTVTTWTCDGCEVEHRRSPSNWLEATFHRRVGENAHSVKPLLLCVGCQERMVDSLEQSPR